MAQDEEKKESNTSVIRFKIKTNQSLITHYKCDINGKCLLDEDGKRIEREGSLDFHSRMSVNVGNFYLQFNKELYNRYREILNPKLEKKEYLLLDFLIELEILSEDIFSMPMFNTKSNKKEDTEEKEEEKKQQNTFIYKNTFTPNIFTKLTNLDYTSERIINILNKEKYKYFRWLFNVKKINKEIMEYSIEDKQKAYEKFFDNMKKFKLYCSNPSKNRHLRSRFVDKHNKLKRPESPRYTKAKDKKSFRFRRYRIFDSENHLIKTPVGIIKLYKDKKYILPPTKTIMEKPATIIKEADGWYMCLGIKGYIPEPLPFTKKAVGLDLGIKHFIYPTEGEPLSNPRPYKKYENKLARLEQKRDRQYVEFDEATKTTKKPDGSIETTVYKKNFRNASENRKKTELQIKKLHQKIKRIREIFLHKASKELLKQNDLIVVENLNIQGLVKRPKSKKTENNDIYEENGAKRKSGLNKAILDCGWYKFTQQLEYKSKWYGKTFIKVDARYTSRDCSTNDCGYRLDSLPLSVREWTCPKCNTIHERDHNASINILKRGLDKLDKTIVDNLDVDMEKIEKISRKIDKDYEGKLSKTIDSKEDILEIDLQEEIKQLV